MDSAADKEERKREYNRLAQREFRRRRKEHLKNLEQAQKEQTSEQTEEIDRLRYQNDELRRENEALRAQIYGSSSSSSNHHLMTTSISDARQYSLSPSISGASMSGTGSPPTAMSDMMPMTPLSALTSSMLTPSMHAYVDPVAAVAASASSSATSSSQPYSMVHPSGLRHHNAQSSPESSGYRSSRSAMGPPFHSLKLEGQTSQISSCPRHLGGHRQSPQQQSQQQQQQQPPPPPHPQPSTMVMAPYDRNKARNELIALFRPLYTDPLITTDPQRHLTTLRSMAESLPSSLRPSQQQLEHVHYYGIDMIPSPSLRERLMSVTPEVSRNFITELGIMGSDRDELHPLIIWGDEPLNEMAWELSQAMLERWGWLLGNAWVKRANFWRRERGASLLPEW